MANRGALSVTFSSRDTRADPFKNVAHRALALSALPVTVITYCRSQGDSPCALFYGATRDWPARWSDRETLVARERRLPWREDPDDEVTPTLDWKLVYFCHDGNNDDESASGEVSVVTSCGPLESRPTVAARIIFVARSFENYRISGWLIGNCQTTIPLPVHVNRYGGEESGARLRGWKLIGELCGRRDIWEINYVLDFCTGELFM